MKRIALGLALALAMSAICLSQETTRRPRILGIAGIRLTVTDPKAAASFYEKILERDRPCVWCGTPDSLLYPVFYAYNDQHLLLEPILGMEGGN